MALCWVCVAVLVALARPCTSSIAEQAFAIFETGVVGLHPSHGSTRNLLQDSAVCGINEYFCGDSDMVSDTAYNAVVAGNCFNDSADTGTPTMRSLQVSPTNATLRAIRHDR